MTTARRIKKPDERVQDVKQTLRRNVSTMRAARKTSQADLARAAGLSRQILSALEQGRANPKVSALVKLAAALDCTVGDLLSTHARRDSRRFSAAGRKPSYTTWLSNPPLESKTAIARDFGVDLTLLAENLRRSPAQRLAKAGQGARWLGWLKQARPARKRSK